MVADDSIVQNIEDHRRAELAQLILSVVSSNASEFIFELNSEAFELTTLKTIWTIMILWWEM